MADRRSLTLLPFLAAGILQPGQGKLSCSVGGTEYYAGEPIPVFIVTSLAMPTGARLVLAIFVRFWKHPRIVQPIFPFD